MKMNNNRTPDVMKRKYLSSLAMGLGLLLMFSCKQPNTQIDTTIEVPVGVIEVSTSTIEEFVSTTGSVYPLKQVTLSSEITGEYRLQQNPATGKRYALGDEIKLGAVIIKLEDEEYVNNLRVRSKEVDMEISKLEYEKQQALYEKGGATLRDLKNAEITQINTAYEMESSRISLDKMTLKAPFSGTVVSGDLSRAIGAPLERGQLLFELVPSDGYRISLQVDEHDVAALEPGQEGSLRLAGLPDAAIPFTVSRIVPVAAAEQGGNHFRVEAELENVPLGLRPGMQGVAKVNVRRESYLWVWTHNLIQRLRLWAWSIGLS